MSPKGHKRTLRGRKKAPGGHTSGRGVHVGGGRANMFEGGTHKSPKGYQGALSGINEP
jgi:hypothetical protein